MNTRYIHFFMSSRITDFRIEVCDSDQPAELRLHEDHLGSVQIFPEDEAVYHLFDADSVLSGKDLLCKAYLFGVMHRCKIAEKDASEASETYRSEFDRIAEGERNKENVRRTTRSKKRFL